MKLNVVMLCDFFDPELAYQEGVLQKYFLSRGHDCTVVCAPKIDIFSYYKNKRNSTNDSYENSSITRLNYRFKLYSLYLLKGIRRKLIELKPDLLFVHDINLSLLIAAIYVRANPNCILICDSHCDKSNSAKNFLSRVIFYKIIKKLIVRLTSSSVHQFYAVAPAGISFLHEMYSIPKDKIRLIPLCVEEKYVKHKIHTGLVTINPFYDVISQHLISS